MLASSQYLRISVISRMPIYSHRWTDTTYTEKLLESNEKLYFGDISLRTVFGNS